ncbi:unnamed protein product [Paramecium octaurelia]|uniref:Uncharacterized protein n=1 Tax=Paramecium octaurelia TaxID=43137 RepID=A0A8S1YJV0_PAROT|nr:unnamed protein product [Paramecium octaurelia]
MITLSIYGILKTGQLKAKLDGHSGCINIAYFFPDGTTLASRSSNEIQPQDNFYKDPLSQFKLPIQSPSILQNDEIDHTILRIVKIQI